MDGFRYWPSNRGCSSSIPVCCPFQFRPVVWFPFPAFCVCSRGFTFFDASMATVSVAGRSTAAISQAQCAQFVTVIICVFGGGFPALLLSFHSSARSSLPCFPFPSLLCFSAFSGSLPLLLTRLRPLWCGMWLLVCILFISCCFVFAGSCAFLNCCQTFNLYKASEKEGRIPNVCCAFWFWLCEKQVS